MSRQSARRHGFAVALAVLLWLGAVALAVVEVNRTGYPPPPHLTPLPSGERCPGLDLGIASTLVYDGDAQSRLARIAAMRNLLGARVVRENLLWNQVEPTEGQPDWSQPDSVVEELRAADLEPLLVVLGSPSWANGISESIPGHDLFVPTQAHALQTWLGHYSQFLADAVRRYDRVVKRWEIWNEPNLVTFWHPRPNPAIYRRVYATLRSAILSVDPRAQVAVGGLGDLTVASAPDISGLAFLRQLTVTHPTLDSVALHPYTTNDHAPNVDISNENNFDAIGRVRDQLVREQERVPIWVTEWGWSSGVVGAARQARYLSISLEMLIHRYPFVKLSTYFLDQDQPPRFLQGLLSENLKPKPAASVFRANAQRLANRCRP